MCKSLQSVSWNSCQNLWALLHDIHASWSIYWARHLFLWLSIGALDVYILFSLHRSSRIGAMFSMPEGSWYKVPSMWSCDHVQWVCSSSQKVPKLQGRNLSASAYQLLLNSLVSPLQAKVQRFLTICVLCQKEQVSHTCRPCGHHYCSSKTVTIWRMVLHTCG